VGIILEKDDYGSRDLKGKGKNREDGLGVEWNRTIKWISVH
jgi:hypothetical protein